MMLPLVVLVLLAATTSSCNAHFSSPSAAVRGGVRVIGVTGDSRRTQSPFLSKSFGGRRAQRSRLYAEATATAIDDDDDEGVIPDHYEELVEDPTSSTDKTATVVVSFKDLGFAGKLVRGTKNLVLVTGTNFGLGLGFGALTAGVRGFPNLMTRKEGMLGTPWSEEIPMRFARYNAKCGRWAKIWGPVFAIWGCTDTLASILRNGENDEYNFMVASAAAAVWHNRESSPTRKVIAGVMYAGLTFGYVKFTEKYIVGTKGWDDKYEENEGEDSSGDDDEESIF